MRQLLATVRTRVGVEKVAELDTAAGTSGFVHIHFLCLMVDCYFAVTKSPLPWPPQASGRYFMFARFSFGSSHSFGIYHEQHDSADERNRSDNRRDEVAVRGLNVQAKKVDGLSRRLECEARVCEHHDAQGD
jgi:hypothetical protein